MNSITDADYKHAKRRLWITKPRPISQSVCTKWYPVTCRHNRKFQKQVHRNIPVHVFSAPSLVFKKIEVKLESLTDCYMLSVVEKGIRWDVMLFIGIEKPITNKWK